MKRILLNPILVLIVTSLTSCHSYRIFPKEYRKTPLKQPTTTVYVINAELSKEFNIFKYSNIYNISNDSTTLTKIKLYPLDTVRRACGQGFVLSVFTLGQFPVGYPDVYSFQYAEISPQATTIKKLTIEIMQRLWFWDIFSKHKNFAKEAGRALYGANCNAGIVK